MNEVPKHFVLSSQAYLAAWSGIAFTASVGALDKYAHGPTATVALGWVGTATGGILLLGVLVEALANQRKATSIIPLLDKLYKHNIPDRGTHVAVQLLSICSVGLSAVNMHNEVWDWQFGLSCSLMVMVFFYNVLYTPSVLVSVAFYNKLSKESQAVLNEQFKATSFIWKLSQVEDRLMPSDI